MSPTQVIETTDAKLLTKDIINISIEQTEKKEDTVMVEDLMDDEMTMLLHVVLLFSLFFITF